MQNLIIDENNFSQYFKEMLGNKPEKDDIIACYTAKAKLVSGDLKKDVINSVEENIHSSIKLLQKMAKARYLDAIKILKEIITDCLSGKTKEEIESKEYDYTVELFYYTKKEYVPKDDPHWSTLKIYNIDNFLDEEKKIKMNCKIVEDHSK